MDKYHIYDEIGKGDFSQVFKGREKKKISYVAIKRVDKGVMNKIVSEVQIIHKLQSPHVMRFYDWYETRNNLWLILEYCTGGDLRSILNQDKHLPESSILLFGLDIVAGLKYIHSSGIIHCDLQPRNLLIDEYGILKFSDFKLARKVPKTPLNDTPLNQRGCTSYMAPELFNSDGSHSFASDLWSLGCVLYELRRGYTTFGAEPADLESNIIRRIREVDINKIPEDMNKSPEDLTTFSATLFDLIQWLLEKSLLNRCSWQDLVRHPFWGNNKLSVPENLPQQHLYEDQLRILQRQRTERMEERVLLEVDSMYSAQLPSRGDSVLPPPPSLLDNTPIRPKQRPSNASLNSSAINGSAHHLYSSPLVSKDNKNNNNSSNNQLQNQNSPNFSSSNNSANKKFNDDSDTGYKSQRGGSHVDHNNRSHNSNMSNDSFDHSSDSSFRAKSESFRDARLLSIYDTCLMHNSDHQVKPLVGNKNIESTERVTFNPNNLPFQPITLIDLLKKSQQELESHISSIYKALYKSVQVILADDSKIRHGNSTIASALEESSDILGYLCSISSSTEVANVVFNTKFLDILLKILSSSNSYWTKKGSSASQSPSTSVVEEVYQKLLVATLLGVFLRYATVIEPPESRNKNEGVIPVFVEILSVKASTNDVKLQRRVIAALGEMLFYIVAQDDSSGGASAASKKEWVGLDEAINLLIAIVLGNKDDICKHFAVKALENIMSQGSLEYKVKLVVANPAIFKKLLQLSLGGYSDAFQISCAMSLVHMVNLVVQNAGISSARGTNTSHLIKYVSEMLEEGSVIANVLELWEDVSSIKLQQAFLNLFCLFYAHLGEKQLATLNASHAHIVKAIVKLMDQSSSAVIRGKSLILLGLMAMAHPVCISSLPERKIVSFLSRVLEPQTSSQVGLNNQPHFDYMLIPSETFTKAILTLIRSHMSALMESLNDMQNCNSSNERDNSLFQLAFNKTSLYLNNLHVLFSFTSNLSIRKHVFRDELHVFITFYSRTIEMIRQISNDIRRSRSSHEFRSSAVDSTIDGVNKFVFLSVEILTQTDSLRYDSEKSEVDPMFSLTVGAICSDLIPLLFHLSNDDICEDSRLVAITCLRRFFATVLKSIVIANRMKFFNLDPLYNLFSEFIGVVSACISFDNPIPQHSIRALEDTFSVLENNGSAECNERVAQIVSQSSLLSVLCDLLTRQIKEFDDGFVDIHLLVLIRKVLDIHADNFELKVTNLPESLFTLTRIMCENFRSSMLASDNKDAPEIPKSAYMELFLHVVDAIHLILNLSIRVLANAVKSGVSALPNRDIDRLKSWNTPLSGFIPMIVSILSFFNAKSDIDSSIYGFFIRQLDLDEAMRKMLLDVSSRCFGIMFDLFPEIVIKEIQLCVRSHEINTFNVISSILNNVTTDPRILLRIMKMTAGIFRVCQSVNNTNCQGCRQLIKASTLEIGLKTGGQSVKAGSISPGTPPQKPPSQAAADAAKYTSQIKEVCAQLQLQIAKL